VPVEDSSQISPTHYSRIYINRKMRARQVQMSVVTKSSEGEEVQFVVVIVGDRSSTGNQTPTASRGLAICAGITRRRAGKARRWRIARREGEVVR